MYVKYDDILRRSPEKPLWWVEGVPHYEPLRPRLATIYGRQVARVLAPDAIRETNIVDDDGPSRS
jgi:hypothetical protein